MTCTRYIRYVSVLALRDDRGAVIAEFALSLPLLVVFMFGFLEAGRYMEHVHVVDKAVRDGVRYATRQDFRDFACAPPNDPNDPAEMQDRANRVADLKSRTVNYVLTGTPLPGGQLRLTYWNDPASVTVNITCENSSSGIYVDLDGGAPVVEVQAGVSYAPVAAEIGLHSGIGIYARAQGAVVGG